jgi:hypothetical protein
MGALVLVLALGVAAAPAMISDQKAARLLDDAWVSDGHRGFFIDGAGSARTPAFSLYETLWQLRLARRAGRDSDGVKPAQVQVWIGGALDGNLTASHLPSIAQIYYAVEILRQVGAPIDRPRVARALERLRSGGRYRSNVDSRTPDWGSTSLAMRICMTLGLPIPPAVAREAKEALAHLETVTASDLGRAISLLEIAGQLRQRRVAPLLRAAAALLATVRPDAVWLSYRASLRGVATRLSVSLPPIGDDLCGAVLNAEGGVSLPGERSSDAQASFYASVLGCRVSLPASPHARGGWPTPAAVAGSLAASTAAARVAARLGRLGSFASPLAAQVREHWLRQWLGARNRKPEDEANLRILAPRISAALDREIQASLPPRSTLAAVARPSAEPSMMCAETKGERSALDYLPLRVLALILACQRHEYDDLFPISF